jgi:hypothetical protein
MFLFIFYHSLIITVLEFGELVDFSESIGKLLSVDLRDHNAAVEAFSAPASLLLKKNAKKFFKLLSEHFCGQQNVHHLAIVEGQRRLAAATIHLRNNSFAEIDSVLFHRVTVKVVRRPLIAAELREISAQFAAAKMSSMSISPGNAIDQFITHYSNQLTVNAETSKIR